uniref:Uncharacterized protein n=1 Tax=Pararge aegeria TaxID=116150 RepID=S4PWH0_9NEOP
MHDIIMIIDTGTYRRTLKHTALLLLRCGAVTKLMNDRLQSSNKDIWIMFRSGNKNYWSTRLVSYFPLYRGSPT